MERERFLPIGTIVLLKEADKKLMITGFLPIEHEADKEPVAYDYSGCVFPEGIVSFDEVLLFNHDQIDKVFHMGFENEESKEFMDAFKKNLDEIVNEDSLEETDSVPVNELENIFDKLREN